MEKNMGMLAVERGRVYESIKDSRIDGASFLCRSI